ncbi:MAG: 2-phospho-L-lactate transferase [Thermoproteota archaeon]|nr:2-phospho-L-lactate transferase [Thermoproteota archaeon]
MITILAGGTGSVKLVRGLYNQFKDIGVISNVADNFWHYGLYICPDIDTIIYGLSNNLDKNKGWGIKKDTFNFLNHMKSLSSMDTWFNLGDKDLTTHIIRTSLLKNGKSLSEITRILSKQYGLSIPILPASDDHYETNMLTNDNRTMHLQEYWIKYRGLLDLKDIFYKNIKKAKPSLKCIHLLEQSKLIVIAPGNPISSIGPIIGIPGMKNIMHKFRDKIVMVSPLVSNKAISGPSENYLKAKNIQPDLKGVINFYSKIATNMIFDKVDRIEIEEKIKSVFPQINFYFGDILMKNSTKELSLARYIISKFY